MFASARPLLAALLLLACDTPATVSPEPTPTPTPTLAPASTPTPSQSPTAPPTADPAPLDITTLEGHVSAKESSGNLPHQLTTRIAELDTTTAGVWRIVLADGATTHWLKLHVPAALPCPLRADEEIQATLGGIGGGPNYYLTMIFTTLTGDLLLAVNATPDSWQITQGKQSSIDRDGPYTERHHGVNFATAGARASVTAGAWARLDVADTTYYVWGSAAKRRLKPGKRPMPDYVGGWLDSAIVRAR